MITLVFRTILKRRLRGPSAIFPALIPFIEILPWLLALVGSMAGATSFFTASTRKLYQHRIPLLIVMVMCFVAGGSIYYSQALKAQITHINNAEDLPTLTAYKPIPDFTPLSAPYEWSRPTKIWSVHIDNKQQFLSSPIIKDDLLFIGTFGNALEARSLNDGSLVWKVQKDEPLSSPPVISGGRIYVGEGLHTALTAGLTALSYPDGQPIWERRFPSHVESYPVVDDAHQRLWVSAGTEGLWALNTKDGSDLWYAPLGHIDSAPLYMNGALYASARLDEHENGSALFKLAPDTGKILWSLPMEGNPMSNVTAVDDTHLILNNAIGQIGLNKDSDAGWIHGVELSDPPKVIWTQKLPTMALPDGQITHDKSVAVYGLKNGEVWALNPMTGDVLWTHKCGDEFKNNLELYEDGNIPFIIGLTADGAVTILNAHTGYELQKFSVGKGAYAAPVYKDGMLYLTTAFFIHAYEISGKREQ